MILKKNKSILKRFYLKPNKTLKRAKSNKKHILTKKSSNNKRRLRLRSLMSRSDMNIYRKFCFN